MTETVKNKAIINLSLVMQLNTSVITAQSSSNDSVDPIFTVVHKINDAARTPPSHKACRNESTWRGGARREIYATCSPHQGAVWAELSANTVIAKGHTDHNVSTSSCNEPSINSFILYTLLH